jgi:hypothetical protein
MERGSEFTPPEGKTVSDGFVAAALGGKWKFPKIGSDLMLTVDYELAPGNQRIARNRPLLSLTDSLIH